MSRETWKPIPSYEGYYEASTMGRVRSVDRIVPRKNQSPQRIRGRVLRPGARLDGYCNISLCRDGKPINKLVHAVIAETYHGARPEGMEVAHLNGNKSDNRPDNLMWKTHVDNEADKLTHGTTLHGEQGTNKLTNEQVLELRRLRWEGTGPSELARKYSIGIEHAVKIAAGRSWSHLPMPHGSPKPISTKRRKYKARHKAAIVRLHKKRGYKAGTIARRLGMDRKQVLAIIRDALVSNR